MASALRVNNLTRAPAQSRPASTPASPQTASPPPPRCDVRWRWGRRRAKGLAGRVAHDAGIARRDHFGRGDGLAGQAADRFLDGLMLGEARRGRASGPLAGVRTPVLLTREDVPLQSVSESGPAALAAERRAPGTIRARPRRRAGGLAAYKSHAAPRPGAFRPAGQPGTTGRPASALGSLGQSELNAKPRRDALP